MPAERLSKSRRANLENLRSPDSDPAYAYAYVPAQNPRVMPNVRMWK
jgi:hypothetical protein